MTKLCKAAFNALVFLLFAGVANAQTAGPPAWQRVNSTEYRFTVLMPADPTIRDITDGPEGTRTRQFFVSLGENRGAYLVRVQHAASGFVFDAVPDGVAERYARAVDIILDSQRAFTFAGVAGREALLHDGDVRHRVIWLAAHNSIYVIGAAGRGNAFQSGPDARQFFESFQLTGTP